MGYIRNDALSSLIASVDPAQIVDKLDADTSLALASYLQNPAYGLFFDPALNHDAWFQPVPLSKEIEASVRDLLDARFRLSPEGDAAAETFEISDEEVEAFREQIKGNNFEVADSHATVKTRGSAQKVFAEAVKSNYGFRCAITGIHTKTFLVAAHIVPWSDDQSIRLDPSNGICLSLLVDRAFETGYLIIQDDLTIVVNWDRVGDDLALRAQFEKYDGQKLNAPVANAPRATYLRRRRAQVA
jgi:HNH endonuclease